MSENRDERQPDAESAAESTTPVIPEQGQPAFSASADGVATPTPATPQTPAVASNAAFQNPYQSSPTPNGASAAAAFAPGAAASAATVPIQPTSPSGSAFSQAQQPTGGHFAAGRYGATAGAPGADLGAAGSTAQRTAPRKRSGAGVIAGALVAAAIVGGAAGLGGSWAGANLWGSTSASGQTSPQTVTVNNTESVTAVTAVAAKVTPSVVTIESSAAQSSGSGSGVILSADGYVLTNTHVVTLDGATNSPTLRVSTSDGRIYDATVVGTDPTYDLAVIKLTDASGLTPITFGDSSSLNVGDQTVAIGAPLGLSNTVTTGIVSALNRSIQIASSAAPEQDSTETAPNNGDSQSPFQFDIPGNSGQSSSSGSISIAVIQTDAAINPGNSGGALVNDAGELIGINVAIASASSSSSTDQSGNIGVGFSIPSNVAKWVSESIIKSGSATHGLLGATVASASASSTATIAGAEIQETTSGGAAASAGLQKGDIVTEFNGVPITSSIDLTAQVRALAGGSTADLTYVRNGSAKTVTVTLGTLTD